MNFNEFTSYQKLNNGSCMTILYDDFVCDWQDEYGLRPEDYVPDMNSMDFEDWLLSNC